MSSISPFKKKDHPIIERLEDIENIGEAPATLEDLKQQRTYRTLLDSDTQFVLGESRKTLNTIYSDTQNTKERTEGAGDTEYSQVDDQQELIAEQGARIQMLERALFLEKSTNQSLREEIVQYKQRALGNTSQGLQPAKTGPVQPQIVGILRNHIRIVETPKDQVLSFKSNPNPYKKPELEQQNAMLRQQVKCLTSRMKECLGLLLQVEDKSKLIDSQHEMTVNQLITRNQYLELQLKEFH